MGDWGPLEIVLVLVLAIGVLNAIGKNTSLLSVPQDNQTVGISEKDARCGLALSVPKQNEQITQSIRVAGSVNGCKWRIQDATALFAQVIDEEGAPLSDFVSVPIISTSGSKNTFDASISLLSTPETKTGTLILIPSVQTDESITVRIPLRFIPQ